VTARGHHAALVSVGGISQEKKGPGVALLMKRRGKKDASKYDIFDSNGSKKTNHRESKKVWTRGGGVYNKARKWDRRGKEWLENLD